MSNAILVTSLVKMRQDWSKQGVKQKLKNTQVSFICQHAVEFKQKKGKHRPHRICIAIRKQKFCRGSCLAVPNTALVVFTCDLRLSSSLYLAGVGPIIGMSTDWYRIHILQAHMISTSDLGLSAVFSLCTFRFDGIKIDTPSLSHFYKNRMMAKILGQLHLLEIRCWYARRATKMPMNSVLVPGVCT